jgi:hypothetical protein
MEISEVLVPELRHASPETPSSPRALSLSEPGLQIGESEVVPVLDAGSRVHRLDCPRNAHARGSAHPGSFFRFRKAGPLRIFSCRALYAMDA